MKRGKFDADAHWRSLMARLDAVERMRNSAAVRHLTGKEILQAGGRRRRLVPARRRQEREFNRKANKKLFSGLRRDPNPEETVAGKALDKALADAPPLVRFLAEQGKSPGWSGP